MTLFSTNYYVMLFSFVNLLYGTEKFGSGFLSATFGHFGAVLLSDAELYL